MIYLKSCTQCAGDVHRDWDTRSRFMKCLQCGKTWNYPKPAERNFTEDQLAALHQEHVVAQAVKEQFELPRSSKISVGFSGATCNN